MELESIRGQINRLLTSLDRSFVERQTHIRVAMQAMLSGQHVLLLGPPGIAKSLLARALCECLHDATFFEYLLSKFTHPDGLFGPVSIPGLKEEDYRQGDRQVQEEAKHQKADIFVVTDGLCRASERIASRVDASKKQANARVLSVVIGGDLAGVERFSDQVWRIDPNAPVPGGIDVKAWNKV